ncbi:peptidoglycan amidohydrolase family protein [Shouchella sp. JSM 1781072]|uniref:peptidoglycan amidohydrolase family protein n=1 Tax=Bacillaceae TaxID=186817 RepID=UPI0020CFF6A7|nr:peptidoglycan amidohydrolase family protein [Alkalihalobacillus sp. LMS6]UTR06715.1 hypothetical protein MM326_01420 [Alkalihalobacillus sp. LMS6]
MGKSSKIILLMSLLFVFFGAILFGNQASAEEEHLDVGELTIEDYETLIEEEILDESVPYEEAKKLFFNPDQITEEDFIGEKLTEEEAEEQMSINAQYVPKKGDIVVTSSTSASGVAGHAGIFRDNLHIIHFQSKAAGIKNDTWSQWKSKYPKTKVLRPSEANRSKANVWVTNNYYIKNKQPTYKINTELAKTNPSYCSKIVWQSYWYGAGSSVVRQPTAGVIVPYALEASFYSKPSVPYNTTSF